MRTRSGREYEFKMRPAKRRRTNPARAIRKRTQRSRGKFEQKVKRIIQKQHPVKVFPNTVALTGGTPAIAGIDFGTNGPLRGDGPQDRTGNQVMLKGVRMEYNYSHSAPNNTRAEDITVKVYVVSTKENSPFNDMWFRNNEGNARISWVDAYQDAGIGRMGILTQPLNTDEYKVHFSKTIKLRCRNQFGFNGQADYTGKSYVKLNKKIEFIQDVVGQNPGGAGLSTRVAVMIYYTHGNAMPTVNPSTTASLLYERPALLGNCALKWYWTEL